MLVDEEHWQLLRRLRGSADASLHREEDQRLEPGQGDVHRVVVGYLQKAAHVQADVYEERGIAEAKLGPEP
eukprot:7382162-Prymnesium_polylepis.1